MGAGAGVFQAWVELRADDPEAVSALGVARGRLASGRALTALHRSRLFEVAGSRRSRAEVEALLHASTQFYNPHKERCTVRLGADEPIPCPPASEIVLVWERGGERRTAAERWWRHETGETVEVREGVVWALKFEDGVDSGGAARELTWLRDARHGLLCNPWSQAARPGSARDALPWMGPQAESRPGGDA